MCVSSSCGLGSVINIHGDGASLDGVGESVSGWMYIAIERR
jgi:hypothetical protein